MIKMPDNQSNKAANQALLKRELEKGLASGVSNRTPAQIRDAIRRAREAA